MQPPALDITGSGLVVEPVRSSNADAEEAVKVPAGSGAPLPEQSAECKWTADTNPYITCLLLVEKLQGSLAVQCGVDISHKDVPVVQADLKDFVTLHKRDVQQVGHAHHKRSLVLIRSLHEFKVGLQARDAVEDEQPD